MIFDLQRHAPRNPAVISGGCGAALTYEQLTVLAEANRTAWTALPRPLLAVLSCRNRVGSIVAYLSCLAAGVPVCLVEPNRRTLAGLVQRYRPSLLLLPQEDERLPGYDHPCAVAGGDYCGWFHLQRLPYKHRLHESLALLLCTSGSTGNPKLVRLSRNNLVTNAASITTCLGLGPDERSVQSLPMQYAYGLSLINSHLYSGGTVVFNPHAFTHPKFWNVFDRYGCTSFAGVPYMYELLHRLNVSPAGRPTLRSMTQAGGGMRRDLIEAYSGAARRTGKRFFVMYGQTEATARMAYVPHNRLGEKLGAVGIAIPGGHLRLGPVPKRPGLRQLVYEGANVMLGYARCPADLSRGDVQQGRLHTGDLGRVDDDGYFYVTGRLNRIAKVFGRRVNLADVENEVERRFACQAAAVESGNRLRLLIEPIGDVDPKAVRRHTAQFLAVRPHAVQIELISRIPLTPSGKKDYASLGSQIEAPRG